MTEEEAGKRDRLPIKSGVLDFTCPHTECACHTDCSLVPTQLIAGDKQNEVTMFLGDVTSRRASEEGIPFREKGGKLLRKMVRKENKRGVSVAYSYLVRNYEIDEDGKVIAPAAATIKACTEHLLRDVKRLKPRKIVIMGSLALKALFPKNKDKIEHCRGQHLQHETLGTVFVMRHPNFVLHRQNLFDQWKADLQTALGSEEDTRKAIKWSKPHTYRLLHTVDEIEEYVEELLNSDKVKVIGIDTETANLNKRYDNTLGTFQFCEDGKRGTVIPYHHPKSGWWPDDLKRIDAALVKLFTHPDPPWRYWLFHNTGFDYRMIFNFGPGVTTFNRPLLDVGMMAYCLDENRGKSGIRNPYSLDSLARDFLNMEKYEDPEIERVKKQGKMLEIDIERLAKYGAGDAVITSRLFWFFLNSANKEQYREKLLNLAENWFAPVSTLNSIMSYNGFWTDIEQLRLLKNEKTSPIAKRMEEIDEFWKQNENAQATNKILLRHALGGKVTPVFRKKDEWVFNLNKQDTKFCLFFDVMGLKPLDFGKLFRTPFIVPPGEEVKAIPAGKLDKAFQESYAGIPEVQHFHEYQGLKKLKTSYVTSIYEFLDPRNKKEGSKDNRVRPSFWVTTTDTGRSSCTDPNLQQVPRSLLYDTLLSTTAGFRQIGDVVTQDIETSVACLAHKKPITKRHKTKHEKAITVETVFGFSVTGSPKHRMLVWDPDKQSLTNKRLDALTVDDYLLIGKGIFPEEGLPGQLTKPLARLIGHLLAGGEVRENDISFNCACVPIMKDYTQQFNNIFSDIPLTQEIFNGKEHATYKVTASDERTKELLKAQGFVLEKNWREEIPACVLQAPRSVVLQFLAAYIENSCTLSVRRTLEGKFIAALAMRNKPAVLAKQLQVLLAALGWVASITETENACYDIVISGEDVVPVLRELPWINKEYHEVDINASFCTTKRIIPGLRAKLHALGKSAEHLYDSHEPEVTFARVNASEKTKAAYRKAGFGCVFELFDYVPAKVSTIRKFVFDDYMYDLTVKDKPYYLANGLVSHNSDNWAKREIKNMFAAEPGCTLIQLDFMTSEVRWWGILSQCPDLAEAFEHGKAAREKYQKLSVAYCAKHPKMVYPILAAGAAMLDSNFKLKKKEELRNLRGEYSDKVLKVAWKLINKDEEFKELCIAKLFAKIAGDIHKNTASKMFNVPITEVTKEQRTNTKSIVFGSMFGRGTKAIAQQLQISDLNEVAKRIEAFFDQFKAADQWMKDIEKVASKQGYVESPLGRRRRLIAFQLGLNDGEEIARAKRIARNSPIQASSSDAAFLGASMLNDWLIAKGKWHPQPTKKCWLIEDVVHDSCVLQVPLEDVEEALAAVRPFFTHKLMKRLTDVWGVNFNLPLEVDFELGLKWGELHGWDNTKLHLDSLLRVLAKEEAKRSGAE